MMAKYPTIARQLEHKLTRRKRLHRIEQLMLNGLTNINSIAQGLGVDPTVVKKDIVAIEHEWLEADGERARNERALRARQFEHIAHMALAEWELSKEAAEEHIEQEKVCDVCDGLGTVESDDYESCTMCDGDGQVEVLPDRWDKCDQCKGAGQVRVPPWRCKACKGDGLRTLRTKKTKKRDGNPAYLKVAKDAIAEAAKVRGAYPGSMSVTKRNVQRSASEVGGQIEEQVEELYLDNVPEDLVIQSKVLLERLQRHMQDGADNVLDAKLVEDDTSATDD